MSEPDYKAIFYSLLASLTLADNMSDVGGDVERALKLAGDDFEWIEWGELRVILGSRGIKTLYNTELV